MCNKKKCNKISSDGIKSFKPKRFSLLYTKASKMLMGPKSLTLRLDSNPLLHGDSVSQCLNVSTMFQHSIDLVNLVTKSKSFVIQA